MEKEYGGTTVVNKTCVARTQTAGAAKTYLFARDVDSIITAESGATRARKKDSTLPGIGVTIERAAHPWLAGLEDRSERLRRPDSITWGHPRRERKAILAPRQDWLDSAEAATELRNDTWWRADAS